MHTGRVFVKQGSQRLILAAPVDAAIDAQAPASWTAAPPTTSHHGTAQTTTTTTAPPESTTTTAPPAESTTTTVAITPETSVVPPGPSVASSTPIVGDVGQPAPHRAGRRRG